LRIRIHNSAYIYFFSPPDTGQKLLLEDEMEELVEVQTKYERERRTRMLLEEKVRLVGIIYKFSAALPVPRFESGSKRLSEVESRPK
jgi:hypothetical protein